jgi:all-trans-retinol dehydrogenase (NAD+)
LDDARLSAWHGRAQQWAHCHYCVGRRDDWRAKDDRLQRPKSAAIGFDDALRVELNRLGYDGIRTTVVCPFYISTGMFKGVKTRFPFLLPIMEPNKVAGKIVHAIEHDKRRLVLPPFALITYPGRLLPLPMFDRLAEFFGINKTMDDFKGHGG